MEKPAREPLMRTHGYLAFIVGICLTVWTCVMVGDAQDAQLRSNFERDSDKVASDTNVRLQTYFDMLLSIKGMFAVDANVTRDDFTRFVRELNLTERYPGFQAIQFVRYVPAAELGRFEQRVRAEIAADPGRFPHEPPYAIHPAIVREDHYIVDYNEPMKRNENAFGLDLAALPPHRDAVEEGRDSGDIIATERITLVQDKMGQPGFVARAPVYRQGMPINTVAERRAAFLGMVAIVFRVNNLRREVIDPALQNQMAFRIHDAGEARAGAGRPADKTNIMYDTSASALTVPGLLKEHRIKVAQRQWVAQFSALQGSRYSRDLRSVATIAIGGVVISALIAALLMAFGRSRRLAEQLRVSLDEQRAFQDSASVGIALFVGGQVMRCNRGMEELLGYEPGELLEKPIQMLAGGSAEVFAIEPQLRRWQGELELVRKDGSALWCLINGKALDAADLSKGGVWVVQDISDRKQTEAALVDAKDGLEHSLAELEQQKAHAESAHSDLSAVLATLKQAQNNLITAEKMASLGALVAGIAHELNTPIGNSLLTASALADMVADFERKYVEGGIKRSLLESHLADSKLACEIMTNSLRRAADLITSFKQVAVDQTSDQRRRFDLCDVVRDTLATYAAQLRRVNCDMRFDAPPSLVMDSYPGSVGQVLSNLINNALLHAFEGRSSGAISITVRPLDDEHIRLVFMDDGIGMPAKILHQVFDPFFTTKMGQGGSGLGMNIVYNIVTGMLGGTIEIESVAGKGTRVTISVPATAPSRDDESMDLSMLIA
jgi:PAS domain S-box-containing protein